MKPLTVGLVYHFNQNTVPNAFVADQVCYRRLLEVFLSHPNCGFSIHVSGTLLTALQWERQETIDLLRQGIAQGQFEILGSAFAQNILLATDDWENVQQLFHHRQQLRDIFGVEPIGFWNPERCWDQDLASLILDAGYEYTFLETNVFRRAGDRNPQAVVRSTRARDRQLVLFPDDTNFITLFGKAVRTGSSDELVEYLYNIWLAQNQSPELDFVAVYAQDAEATGLWQFEGGGQSLDDVFDKLDAVLYKLEKLPWLQVGGLAEKARSANPVCMDQLPPGQANWMVDSLRSENLPWGDPEYADWFDYSARAAKNILAREVFHQVSRRLRDQEILLADRSRACPEYVASRRLYDLAVRTLVVHQYEFGCIGIAVDKEAQWQLARTALVVLWASRLAAERKRNPLVWNEDVNGDGIDEIAVVYGAHAYVFAPMGARLLYWFDLDHGRQLVGNQNASCYLERYRDDHSYVDDFHGEKDVFPQLTGKPEVADLASRRYVMRRRCLNDTITFDNRQQVRLYDLIFEPEVGEDGGRPTLEFRYDGRLLSIRKSIVCLADGLEVHYTLERHPGAKQLRFRVENEVTPDYSVVLDRGKSCLDVRTSGSVTTVINKASSCAVAVTMAGPETAVPVCQDEPGFLAWLCTAETVADLFERDSRPLDWTLSLRLV